MDETKGLDLIPATVDMMLACETYVSHVFRATAELIGPRSDDESWRAYEQLWFDSFRCIVCGWFRGDIREHLKRTRPKRFELVFTLR